MRVWTILTIVLLLTLPLAPTAPLGPAAVPRALPATTPAAAAALSWQITWVDAPRLFADMGTRSLVLDDADHPHIAYGKDRLYHAWHDGSDWQLETADAALGVGQYASLALDGAGQLHISYYDAANAALKYTFFNGTDWITEKVDNAGDVGRHTSLALDGAGRPHITYRDDTNNSLKYARFDGSTWLIETVDAVGHLPATHGQNSLALDANDRPHISYCGLVDGSSRLRYAHFNGFSWLKETVDNTSSVGAYSSLALDGAGRPHISYYASNGTALKYAYFDGLDWQMEIVDTVGTTGWYTSLALDTAGRPRISYLSFSTGQLWYAQHDGVEWQLDMLDDAHAGWHTSLALDGADQPHISYARSDLYGFGFTDLVHTRLDGAAWQTTTVDHYRAAGPHNALALDSAGRPHISYYLEGAQDLWYARMDSAGWQREMVYGAGTVGLYNSLALDAADRPHISYADWDQVRLRYAYWDGASWVNVTADATAGVGKHTSLALDSAGRPHISYCRYSPYDTIRCDALKYAYFDGAAWQTRVVDSVGDIGAYNSLALDSADRPHISYHDQTALDLRYAYFDGGAWLTTTVDSAGNVGAYTSLALDGADRPHISYYDTTRTNLKYAYLDDTGWLSATVDSTANVGQYTSLALDGTGRPHMSYYDATNGALKYAYFDGGAWVSATVDSAGDVGQYTSLALDGAGRPHISYYDATGGDLKCAEVCVPLTGVSIAGPATWPMGQPVVYAAPYDPPDATWPLTVTWENGHVGLTAPYSWTLPGLYTLTVTATNCGGQAAAALTVTVFCQPVEGVAIAGPAALVVGQTGLYTATFAPPTATLPMTLTWDNGQVGPTAAYSWTVPGLYTLTVTATNACGPAAAASLTVQVCQPVEGVAIAGPSALVAGQTGLYTATFAPPTATLPITLTWDNGQVGPTAAYSWTAPGLYTLTVTATNGCGPAVAASLTVQVCQPVEGVAIAGPAELAVGQTGLYTATFAPPTATLPVTLTWDNGQVGATAAYSWSVTGNYTLAVTAANACGGPLAATMDVLVVSCEPVQVVTVTIAISGCVVDFAADLLGHPPFAYRWDFGDGMTDTAALPAHNYGVSGTYSGTLAVWNCAGSGYDERSFVVTVACAPPAGYRIYLPLTWK